ncbi:MAG: hypothetical protein AAFR92_04230 [Pseudomonadota bacterium]
MRELSSEELDLVGDQISGGEQDVQGALSGGGIGYNLVGWNIYGPNGQLLNSGYTVTSTTNSYYSGGGGGGGGGGGWGGDGGDGDPFVYEQTLDDGTTIILDQLSGGAYSGGEAAADVINDLTGRDGECYEHRDTILSIFGSQLPEEIQEAYLAC